MAATTRPASASMLVIATQKSAWAVALIIALSMGTLAAIIMLWPDERVSGDAAPAATQAAELIGDCVDEDCVPVPRKPRPAGRWM